MPATLGDSIIDSLTGVVDSIRSDLSAVAGDHPFRLYRVVRTWTGNDRGEGDATEVETEIVPRPVIVPLVRYDLEPGGRQEDGDLKATEISLAYAESDLTLEGAAANVELFYRVKGQDIGTREYTLARPPYPDRQKAIGWELHLRRSQR